MTFGRAIGGFNRSPFNSDAYSDTFEFFASGSASSIGSGFVITRIIDTTSTIRQAFNQAKFNSTEFSNVLYTLAESDTISSCNADAESIYYVTCSAKTISSPKVVDHMYQVISMVYSGTVAVGERVCIDGNNFTVTLDGANAIDKYDGDFPEIMAGDNDIVYSDSEGSRTVKVIVSRTDRKI